MGKIETSTIALFIIWSSALEVIIHFRIDLTISKQNVSRQHRTIVKPLVKPLLLLVRRHKANELKNE